MKSKQAFTAPSPWSDRFNAPSVERLGAALPAPAAGLFRSARKMLHDAGLAVESVAWHGESWRWTVEFRSFASAEVSAMLVPAPENLQLAVPVSRDFVQGLPMRRLKKAVREGLELASEPFDTRLAIWCLTTPGQLADLHDLLQRRVRHAAKKTG